MATTNIFSIHGSKGRSVIRSLTERTDYVKNPEKTENGLLVYTRVGRELAERFLKGKHAYIVCTHVDKKHIHSHIIFNSTTLDGTVKFRDFLGSGRALGRLSDLICLECGLSVIANPQRYTHPTYDKWLGEKKPPSHRDTLRADIDAALARKPKTFDELLNILRQSGWAVSVGAHVTFHKPGQRAIRLHSLGEGYSEAELHAVIGGSSTHTPRGKRERASLLIDIEAKLAAGKGGGYERWVKVFNVKQMAKTLLYLQEHGIKSRAELTARADAVSEKLSAAKERITALDARIAEVNALRGQIIAYAKTREIFAEYKSSRYSRKFYDSHADEIEQHRESKRYFNERNLTRLPKVKDLNAEFSALVAEKRATYAEYRALRDEHRELLIHRENVERFLSGEKSNPDRRNRGER